MFGKILKLLLFVFVVFPLGIATLYAFYPESFFFTNGVCQEILMTYRDLFVGVWSICIKPFLVLIYLVLQVIIL